MLRYLVLFHPRYHTLCQLYIVTTRSFFVAFYVLGFCSPPFIWEHLHQPINMAKTPSNDRPKSEALTNPASDLQPVTAGGDQDKFSCLPLALFMSL
jgi:hypothetical protein